MVYMKSLKNQEWLLPPNIEELIPEDHICFLVESLVESMDYTSFDERYAGAGHPAYHPRIIIKLIIMAMLDSIRSSRKIARLTKENVVYMYLAEKLKPDFRTISDFRKDNQKIIKEIFKQTVILARKLGCVGLQHLCLDGSTIKASAANDSVISKEELGILEEFTKNELKEGLDVDEAEDQLFDSKRGSDQLDTKSKKKLRSIVKDCAKRVKEDPGSLKRIEKKISNAKHELETQQLKRVSLTDPQARFMKQKKGGVLFSYNPQVTVDSKCGIIVANEATNAEDVRGLQKQVLQAEETLGNLEDIDFMADNNYYEGENLYFLSNKNIKAYIPDQESAAQAKGKRIEKGKFCKDKFRYKPEKDLYIYPGTKEIRFEHKRLEKGKMIRVYRGSNCRTCPFQKECTKSKKGTRIIKSYPHEKERTEMNEKMKTAEAKKTYKMRAKTVEPVIGHIKQNIGIREFTTRGKTTKVEFDVVCIANNLRRIWNHTNGSATKLKMKNHLLFN